MLKRKMIIDFDNTLFNAGLFKHDLFAIFSRHGFSQKEIEDSYRASYQNGYAGPEFQLDLLTQRREIDRAKIDREVHNLIAKADLYLFEGAVDFLERAGSNFEIILMTVGNYDYQRAKVANCGIGRYFSREPIYVFHDSDKDVALREVVASAEHFIIIDDKAETIAKVESAFGKEYVLGIVTRDGRFPDFAEFNQELRKEPYAGVARG